MSRRLILVPLLLAAVLAGGLAASDSHAFRLPAELLPLKGNPANRLAHLPPDPIAYDRARRCDPPRGHPCGTWSWPGTMCGPACPPRWKGR